MKSINSRGRGYTPVGEIMAFLEGDGLPTSELHTTYRGCQIPSGMYITEFITLLQFEGSIHTIGGVIFIKDQFRMIPKRRA